ncbi:hypothetical protein [Cryobacterium zhongshanensis]|uniref:Uncharacterized protein n=1 Tax=Cryobacterium zhongshanensis TaxID=2928153 RepID=A0AA41QY10_9MICO|nr:hypothetical protein [Cryobacterium zhongshanensis]MCI4659565.1 hypothetical protein [Cryobacterium zhongshanensis]
MMKNEYAMVIAAAMVRAAMRTGKRDGTICFLAWEDDAGKREFGAGFSDGQGHEFVELSLSDEEVAVARSVLGEWERQSHGALPWIDFIVVATMSSRGPNGIALASSTVPRSLLSDRYRSEARRLAHTEPLVTRLGHAAEVALAQRGRRS